MVDGSGFSPYNQIVVYSNLTSAGLPWTSQPDYISPPTCVAGLQGNGYLGYFRAGLSLGTNGVLYESQDRANLSNPNLQVWNTKAFDPANSSALATAFATTQAYLWPTTPIIATNLLWSSYWFSTNGSTITTNDYTVTGTPALPELGTGPAELALSPDNRYLALVHDDAHVTLFTLTNGIPDISTEYLIKGLIGTGTGLSGRYIGWDAGDNLWLANRNSAVAAVFQISLGRTATATTTGNASGPTGFTLLSPTEVDVTQLNLNNPNASQANSYGNPTSVTNVITRYGNVSSPLLVSFTTGGTAPASSYTASVTGSILFAPGQTTTNIVITAVSDGVSRPTTTVVVTLNGGSSQYNVGNNNAATDYIVNTATPQLVLGTDAATMYRAFSNDFSSITITRWGDTNTAFTTSGFTYGGTAARNTDYATLSSGAITFNKGDLTKTINIAKPLINGQPPVHSTSIAYVGDKTITVTPSAGTGYTSYSSNNVAALTILDSAYPPATVLWSDPLTNTLGGVNGNDDGSGQWNITALVGDSTLVPNYDYNADFGYDLTVNNGNAIYNGLIPLPPNGATTALRVTANKSIYGSQAAAVNLYPTNMTFSGDYAVRFNMYIVQGSAIASSAEGPLFGINHDGMETNWWYYSGTLSGGPWSSDGVWYYVTAWAAVYPAPWYDMTEFTGVANTIPNAGWRIPAATTYASFLNSFKTVDFTSVNTSTNLVGGLPANASPFVLPNTPGNWADVEIKQVNNVVTMSIDKTVVFSLVNTNSLFQQGKLMLGYEVPNAEYANPDAAAYFSNLQVVQLAGAQAPTISRVAASGGNIVIQFVTPNSGDTTASFALQRSTAVNGSYTDVSPAATFTQVAAGTFQTVYPQNGPVQFYRIRHL